MAKLPELIRTAPHIERRIHAALSERRRKPTGKEGRLPLSQIGDCERNLWAGLNGIQQDREIDPRILVLFDHGNAVESHVIDLLRLAGFCVVDVDPDTGEQFRVTDCDGRASGRLDGKIELGTSKINRHMAVLEIKSANTKQFEACVASGYEAWNPKYADQLQVYMGLSGLEDSLAIVYAKETSHLYAEKIRVNHERFSVLRAKAERIVTSAMLLERPAEAKSQYCGFCKWCPRNQWCWGPLAGVKFDD